MKFHLSAVFVAWKRSLSLDFQIWYPNRWVHAWCSSKKGRFELVNERFSEIFEPVTDGLESKLFTLRLIAIWRGYIHSSGISWPLQYDDSMLMTVIFHANHPDLESTHKPIKVQKMTLYTQQQLEISNHFIHLEQHKNKCDIVFQK